jgi:hypothetical protein
MSEKKSSAVSLHLGNAILGLRGVPYACSR